MNDDGTMDLKNNYCKRNGKKCKKVHGNCNTCDWVMACTCNKNFVIYGKRNKK